MITCASGSHQKKCILRTVLPFTYIIYDILESWLPNNEIVSHKKIIKNE